MVGAESVIVAPHGIDDQENDQDDSKDNSPDHALISFAGFAMPVPLHSLQGLPSILHCPQHFGQTGFSPGVMISGVSNTILISLGFRPRCQTVADSLVEIMLKCADHRDGPGCHADRSRISDTLQLVDQFLDVILVHASP
jgi:hypothetical protein